MRRLGIVDQPLVGQQPIAVRMDVEQVDRLLADAQRTDHAAGDIDLVKLAVVAKSGPAIFQRAHAPCLDVLSLERLGPGKDDRAAVRVPAEAAEVFVVCQQQPRLAARPGMQPDIVFLVEGKEMPIRAPGKGLGPGAGPLAHDAALLKVTDFHAPQVEVSPVAAAVEGQRQVAAVRRDGHAGDGFGVSQALRRDPPLRPGVRLDAVDSGIAMPGDRRRLLILRPAVQQPQRVRAVAQRQLMTLFVVTRHQRRAVEKLRALEALDPQATLHETVRLQLPRPEPEPFGIRVAGRRRRPVPPGQRLPEYRHRGAGMRQRILCQLFHKGSLQRVGLVGVFEEAGGNRQRPQLQHLLDRDQERVAARGGLFSPERRTGKAEKSAQQAKRKSHGQDSSSEHDNG